MQKSNVVGMALSLSFCISCHTISSKVESPLQPTNETQNLTESAVIKYDYKHGEIKKVTEDQISITDARIADVIKIPVAQKNFSNTIEAFEQITSDLAEHTTPATFMYYVSTNKDIRAEAENAEATLSQYNVALMSRRDLYEAIVKAAQNAGAAKENRATSVADKRLVEQTLKAFRKNGLFLPDAELAKVKELRQKLAVLETQFAANLNENTDYAEMSREDLDGVPESMSRRLEKLPDGKFKVTTKMTDYVVFMENAKNSDARRRMQEKYDNRAAEANTKLMTQAVSLRREVANLLKFNTWADYRTEDRMAKDSKHVWAFLKSLRAKLEEKNKKDLAKLLKLKKEMEPGSRQLDAWDGTYYANQLKKRDYSVDDEVVREYFPSDRTVAKLFEIYSELLGVKFVQVPDAKVWAPEVKLYEIRDADDNHFIADFFTDFVPRDGKYGHAAAFTLRPGRLVDGHYVTPISAIVANFNPPADGKPSLLSHDEVETLFHEFGHIMHQTLTKAPYAMLSGTSVAQDFVEAPSQMLENWVWEPEILKQVAGHYKDPEKKMPGGLLKQLIKTRYFNLGYFYTRQLLFGIFDMSLHTDKETPDVTALYKKLYKELTTLNPLPDTHFPAGFGHLMGGYDAGYYGYLWSEVFAQDMFTKFEGKHLLDPKVGRRYRETVLEQGDVYPADKLLVKFLGRKPSNKAFFKHLQL